MCVHTHIQTRTHTHTHTQISFLFKSEHTYPLQIQIYFIKHTFTITVYWAAMSCTLHTREAQPPSFHENSSIIRWTQIYHLFQTALCHTPKDHVITAVRTSNFTLRFMKQFWSCTRSAVLTVLLRIQTSGKGCCVLVVWFPVLERMVRFFLDCLTLEAEGTMTLLKAGNYSPKDIVSLPRRYKSSNSDPI
jgi:hypothetical protein